MLLNSTKSFYVSFVFLITVFISNFLYADVTNNRVEVSTFYNSSSKKQYNYYSKVTISVPDGWYFYASNPGDIGKGIELNLLKSQNISSYKKIFPIPQITKKEVNLTDEFVSYIYPNQTDIFLVFQKTNDKDDFSFELEVDYTLCNDQECVPKVDLFTVDEKDLFLGNNKDINKFITLTYSNEILSAKPQLLFDYNHLGDSYYKGLMVSFSDPSQIEELFIYDNILLKWDLLNIQKYGKNYFIPFRSGSNKNLNIDNIDLFFRSDNGNEYQLSSELGEPLLYSDSNFTMNEDIYKNNIFALILFSILSGIILNFMPCSLSLLLLNANYDKEKNKTISLIANVFGILTVSLGIASVLLLSKSFGYTLNLGFYWQSPIFLSCLIVFMVIFISNSNFLYRYTSYIVSYFIQVKSHNYLAEFLGGGVHAFVALSCSAPILGTALFISFFLSSYYILLSFFFIGIGIAIPKIAINTVPAVFYYFSFLNGWKSNVLLHISYLLYFILVFWLFVILNQIAGLSNIFLVAGIAFILNVWIYCYTDKNDKLSYKKFFTNSKFLYIPMILIAVFLYDGVYSAKKNTENYLSIGEKQSQINWHDFKIIDIDNWVNNNYIVVINITAKWCFTCLVNDFSTFSSPKVIALLNEPDIITMQADITSYSKIVNDYIHSYKRMGIPLTIIYSKNFRNGMILNTLLTPSEMKSAIEKARGKVPRK